MQTKRQIQMGLFSSDDDIVCTDARGLLVSFSEETGRPVFIEAEGKWLMSIDGVAWVEQAGSVMGLDSENDIEVFKAGDLNAWLVTAVMDESFPSFVGNAVMAEVFVVEIVGTNTVKLVTENLVNGISGPFFFNWSVDGWTRIEEGS
jgi:hypothetical protein